MNWISMENIDLGKNNLKKFGITMGFAFLTITLFIFLRHRHSVLPTSIISAVFFILAFVFPSALRLFYIFWMKLAFLLSWINTRLILIAVFYLLFTPIGLSMRLFGADLLDKKMGDKKDSYWKKKEKNEADPHNLEKQF